MSDAVYDFPNSTDCSDGAPILDPNGFDYLGKIDPSWTVAELTDWLRENFRLDRLRPTTKASIKQVISGLLPRGVSRKAIASVETVSPRERSMQLDLVSQVAIAILLRDAMLPALDAADAGEDA